MFHCPFWAIVISWPFLAQFCHSVAVALWQLPTTRFWDLLNIHLSFADLTTVSPKCMGPKCMQKVFKMTYISTNIYIFNLLKFSFSEKATKICAIRFWRLLSKWQNHKADFTNFCGLLRKVELYLKTSTNSIYIIKWVT